MRLSVAIIVKNEEAVLGHCLESVRGLADEIVVIDTGSTDNTMAIAEQAGAKIGHFAWQNDFAAARNESLRICTGDWILILDADEAIDALDYEPIRKACDQETHAAYRLTVRNYFRHGGQSTLDLPSRRNTSSYTEGRDCPYYGDFPGLRLCKNLPGLAFVGRIHELLDPFLEERHLEIGSLDAVIHHYGKLFQDREDFKKQYYLDLALKDAQAHPKNHQYQFNLMQQALMAEQWDWVLKACEAYMKLQREVPSTVLLAYGIALQCRDRHAESLKSLGQLLKALPNHAPALTRQGISFAALGRTEEARKSFRKAMAAQPDFVLPALNLAELELALGQTVTARSLLLDGLKLHPENEKFHETLIRADLMAQDTNTAVQDAWAAIQKCPGAGQGVWHRLVAVWLIQQNHPDQAKAILEAGLQSFPDNQDLVRLKQMIIPPSAPASL